MKTNGARFLESLGIPFELREYEVDPEDLIGHHRRKENRHASGAGLQDSAHHWQARDIYVFAVIPGDAELDFKKLARAAGLRKAEMVSLKDVQPLTGYIRGGVTVFGAKKAYPVFVDETAILFDTISVSAGTRGTQLILSPADYLRAAEAQTADLTKDTPRLTTNPGAPGLASETWESSTTDPRTSSNEQRPLDSPRQRPPH